MSGHLHSSLDFVTMGMFIVDEIHFKPPKPPEIDILGGAGSWSVIGARLFRPPPTSKNVGWIVHRGSDFPDKLSDQIESWQTNCNLIDTPDRLTTRGWNSYGDDEARGKLDIMLIVAGELRQCFSLQVHIAKVADRRDSIKR